MLKKITPKKPRSTGSVVSLKGSGFGMLAEGVNSVVEFGGATIGQGHADLVSWTDRKIRVRLPAGGGTVQVRVRTAAGVSDPVDYTYAE